MGKPYQHELAQLRTTLDWASAADISPLARAVTAAATLPVVAVASGGSLTAAHLLVHAHRRFFGEVAAVVTPLEAATIHRRGALSTWLLSAGGSNVDIVNAFSAAVRREPKQLVVICGRRGSKLERAAVDNRGFVDYIDAE